MNVPSKPQPHPHPSIVGFNESPHHRGVTGQVTRRQQVDGTMELEDRAEGRLAAVTGSIQKQTPYRHLHQAGRENTSDCGNWM